MPGISTAIKAWNNIQKRESYRIAYREYIAAQALHVQLTGDPYVGPHHAYNLNAEGKNRFERILDFQRDYNHLPETPEFKELFKELEELLFRLVGRKATRAIKNNPKDVATVEADIIEGLGTKVVEARDLAMNAARPFRPGLAYSAFFHLLNPAKTFEEILESIHSDELRDSFVNNIEDAACDVTDIYPHRSTNPYALREKGKILIELDVTATKSSTIEQVSNLIERYKSNTGFGSIIGRGPAGSFRLTTEQMRRIDALVAEGKSVSEITKLMWDELKSENDGNIADWIVGNHLHSSSVYKLIQRYLRSRQN